MSHKWMSRVPHMSNIWTSHASHISQVHLCTQRVPSTKLRTAPLLANSSDFTLITNRCLFRILSREVYTAHLFRRARESQQHSTCPQLKTCQRHGTCQHWTCRRHGTCAGSCRICTDPMVFSSRGGSGAERGR